MGGGHNTDEQIFRVIASNHLRAHRKIQLRARTSRRDSCAVQAPPLALIWFTAIFRGALKELIIEKGV